MIEAPFKKYYVLILLIFVSCWLSAQSKSIQKDLLKLETLEQDFFAKSKQGPAAVKNEFYSDLLRSQEKKDIEGCAYSSYFIGKIQYSLKRFDSAEYYINQAKGFAVTINNIPLQVATTRALGGLYYHNQLNSKALKELHYSIELANSINDTSGIAKAYNNIGLVYKSMENYQEAITFLERSLNLKIAIGDKASQTTTLTNMGFCYSMLGLYTKADYFFNKAILSASEQQHNPQISRIWVHMAQNYAREGKPEQAQAFFQKSILMSQQIGDSMQVAYSRKSFAEFFHDANYLEKADQLYQKILPVLGHISDGFFLSEFYLGIADNYAAMGQPEEANTYYNQLLTVLPPYNKFAMRQGMNTLSDICKKHGEYQKALIYLERSNEIAEELKDLEKDKNLEKYKIEYNTAQNEADIEQLIEINEDLGEQKQQNQVLLLTVLTLFFITLVVAVALGIVAKKSRANEDKLQVEIVKNQRKNLELQQANERVNKWSKIKGEFITMISHEVRTPLNAIIGMTQFLRDTNLNQSQINKINNIDVSSYNLLTLMNDILDFSSLQENKLKINVQPTNFSHMITSLQDTFQPQFEENEIQFTVTKSNDLPESVYTDEHRVKQVLSNLLSNALKFTHFGTVNFHIETTDQYHDQGDQFVEIKFTVTDTGIGVPEDKQSVLFKSFTQTDSTVTRKYRGVGLGLSICAGILEEFNTKIEFNSKFGEGSTFWFPMTFKVNKPVETVEVKQTSDSPLAMAELHPMKILVAEDNAINRSLMKLSLLKLGYNPVLVENGQEAVEACKHAEFDVILMDIQMPILDGISATKSIRLLSTAHRPTIIAVTANAIGDEKEQYIKSGMDDYLAKPYTIQQLTSMLKKHGPSVVA